MAKLRTVVIAGTLGAALAYLFDPERGRGRRARLQDQLGAAVRRGRRGLEGTARQLQDGARGTTAELTPGRSRGEDDLTVLARVQSQVFGMPDFPKGRVDAEVTDGRLVLRGEVESEEQAERIVRAADGVPGVREVESLLHRPGEPAPNKTAARRAGR